MRLIGLLAAIMLMASPGCAGISKTPLHETFARIKVGSPLDEAAIGGAATHAHDGGRLLTGERLTTHDEKFAQVRALERIAVLTDDADRVIGKRYELIGDEWSWKTTAAKSLVRAEWVVAAPPGDRAQVIQSVRERCAALPLAIPAIDCDWPVAERYGEEGLPWVEGNVSPDALLDAASTSARTIGRSLHYDRWIVRKPGEGRTRWRFRSSPHGIADLSVEHRFDVSLVALTAAGWAHILATGETP